MKLSDLKTNTAMIEEPQWIGDLPGMGDLRLHVRGLRNRAYRMVEQELLEKLPRAQKIRGNVSPADRDRILGMCLADTVLVGWEGVADENGQAMDYTPEFAKMILTDPDFEKFQAAVVAAATRVNEAAEANAG